MKIESNYNRSFGMRMTYNEPYKSLVKCWNINFKPKVVEKALAKIKGCASDAFELTITDGTINPKTLHMGAEFSYTDGAYVNALKIPTAIKVVKPNPNSSSQNQYVLLNPKEVAKDIIQCFKDYKKSISMYLGK